MGPKPRAIGELAREVVRSLAHPSSVTLAGLSDLWNEAAGPVVSLKTRVLGVRRGTLLVSTESSALKSEIEAYRRPEILRKLGALAAPLRIVRLQVVLAE